MSEAASTQSNYKAEIDGLRAFAVLSVVWYHAFPTTLTGGFIGVDVFFVISGYLITAHIFTSLDANTFSFANFFARRIRRIFPALVLVMLCSLIFGWLALLSGELHDLGKHVAAGAAFIVNFIFVAESGYFDTAAETKPMLHLWSLAVEEQFYIVWPLVLWLTWKLGASLLWLTLIAATASFAFNIHFAERMPTEVFFWPFGRFWELLSGSLLAWTLLYNRGSFDRHKARVDGFLTRMVTFGRASSSLAFSENLLALGGLCILVGGAIIIHSGMLFPYFWALAPVCGALLIIVGGASAWSNRILFMNPIAVWFGLISYPLYLWHWPILSFLQIVESGEVPHRDARIAAVVLAILLAWVTVNFVEKPLRFGKKHVRAKVSGLVAAMVIMGISGLALNYSGQIKDRTPEDLWIKRPDAGHIYGTSSKWYWGKDDWLFLGNAYNDTVAKLKLSQSPQLSEISREAELFRDVAYAAEATKTSVSLLIGPNKSSIYPEYLPDEIIVPNERYISDFLYALNSIPNLTTVDPTQDLTASKEDAGLLYQRTDTHWNNKGAFFAFVSLAQTSGWPVPDLTFDEGGLHFGGLIGISKLDDVPVNLGDNWDVNWADKPILNIEELSGEADTPFGTAKIVRNANPLSESVVWVIGDSFTHRVSPFINATFKEVHYIGHWRKKLETLPAELRQAEIKPDHIIIVRVERSF